MSLAHAEETYELLAGITDRGSDQASSESALLMLDGEIRFFVANVLTEVLAQTVRESAGGGSAATHRRVEPLPADRGVCFTGPDVDRAAALLERGRGMLLARQLEGRADLSELQSSHPVLARRFEQLAEQIAATPDALASLRPHDNPPGPGIDRTAWSKLAKLRASREIDELITLIRSKANFAQFLRPLSAPRLRDLAADGPIVILNHPEFGYCDALVVTPQAITAVRLNVKSAEVEENARLLRDAIASVNTRDESRPTPDRLLQAGTELRRMLAWTWHKVVRPVLTVAGACETIRDGAAWPRIWWIPTGSFNLLPLHAAQCSLANCDLEDCRRQDGPRGALDVAVSSYVPRLQALAHARARAARRPSDERRAVLVAAHDDELPGVEAAARYAAGLLGADSVLVGPEATRSAVMHLLSDATWAHFGCHATSDSALPSSSRLQLPSGELVSVLDICRIQPNAARMAFLAACGTARSAERLSDESIHITSSFLIAGFPEAVGTLWEVGSSFTEQLTRDFYERALGSSRGSDDEQSTALAVHHTIRELRRRFPERAYAWAAYVHAGA